MHPHRPLAVVIERVAGVRPLVALAASIGPEQLTLAPTERGDRLVLGIADDCGDNAVVTLTVENVTDVRDAMNQWLAAQ